ncbi:hypothetical protein [Burkholderia sp. BCC1998]|uniref:hypothetical protein n=1 Tax=Burkholderia sp. BCC1998 TaxID=2817447 RepID=UPI002AB743C9|nr:hypothetical protein [Burkholderia sp. BCC1998]
MKPPKELEKFLNRYADIDVQESAGWLADVVSHLTRFKRPNLAIVAIVATVAIDAYRSPPHTSIIYAAFFAIVLLGVVGGRRDG